MDHRINHVCFYADSPGDVNRASDIAVTLAKHHGARLTVISVLETSDAPFLKTPVGREVAHLIREEKRKRLNAVVERIHRDVPPEHVTAILLEGEVAWHTLTAYTVANPVDLVIVAADTETPVGGYGSFSMHLFRKCPAPVLSVRPGASASARRVLIAINPGTEDSDERTLSREVLRITTGLFDGTGVELHLVHAWDLLGEDLIVSRYGTKGVQPYLDLQLDYARTFTDQLLAEAGVRDRITGTHFPKGEPSQVVPSLAEELDADIVILGSAARRGLEGLFIASVAETILNGLERSALVIKRPGFTSPVRPLG
ncbi:MAG: universal stress protein [Thermoanaerobaculia bacterium]